MQQGLLVAVDGPKAVGKSTVLECLSGACAEKGMNVHLTKEPTPEFHLDSEEALSGIDLARLVAADRARHVNSVIIPRLARGEVVVSDRYIASSLCLQTLDGVPFEQVWQLNRQFPLPDLNILMLARADVIAERRSHRSGQSRFDRQRQEQDEIEMYLQTEKFLRSRGVPTNVVFNNGDQSPQTLAEIIVDLIEQWINAKGR